MLPGWVSGLALLLALVTATLALVLATIANRRWASRPRPERDLRTSSDGGLAQAPRVDQREGRLTHAGAPTSTGAPTATGAPTSDETPADADLARQARAALAEQLTVLRAELGVLADRVSRSEDLAHDTALTLDETLGRVGLAQAAAAESLDRAGEATAIAAAATTAANAATAAAGTATDPTALRHVAIVRYDAYADVGGRLSYSVALLDDTRSGLVLTTLSGKAEVRTYVRAVSGGVGDGTLTDEEQQAVTAAAAGIPGSQS